MSTIDDYFAKLNEPQRLVLEQVRGVVKRVVPEAIEAWSYGMPAFKYKGKYLVGFAAFKNHLGFYPTPEPIEALKDRLGEFGLAKGTVQFTVEKPLSDELIKELVMLRLAEIEKG